MNISQRGINAIKAHEGLRLEAYPDPASGGDPWTIGHGHTQGVRQGQTISAAQAEDFLREDLYWVEQCIRDTVRVPLNQEQYDALCSLIFNIGGGAFGRSTLLQRLNDGDYKAAAAEFMRWDMAAGKRMPGLTKRREAEMALFTAGPIDQAPVKQPSSTSQAIPAGEASAPEQTMAPILVAIGKTFLGGLASGLIDAFTPLAKEKVTKELERHGADSAAATQIVGAVVDAAKAATGLANPAAAVVEAGKAPEVVQRVEADTLDTIDKMMPLLLQVDEMERKVSADNEASRNAAADRAHVDGYDMAQPLLIGAFVVVGLLILLVGAVVVGQLIKTGKADTEVWAALTGLIGWATAKAGSIYDYRFGTSRSSAAKDVVIGELSRRKQ